MKGAVLVWITDDDRELGWPLSMVHAPQMFLSGFFWSSRCRDLSDRVEFQKISSADISGTQARGLERIQIQEQFPGSTHVHKKSSTCSSMSMFKYVQIVSNSFSATDCESRVPGTSLLSTLSQRPVAGFDAALVPEHGQGSETFAEVGTVNGHRWC